MIDWDLDDRPILSDRERDILVLIAGGLSAKEVALRCDISPRTVEHHIENIRNKLRARNRAHIVAKAMAYGELPVPESA